MRILIVDGQPLFREGLGSLLGRFYPSAAVFEVGSVEEATGMLSQYVQFDLIILEIFSPGTQGLASVAILREKFPNALLVVMSGVDDSGAAITIIEHGARGYITKSAGVGDVRNAMHLILKGEIYISPSMLAGDKSPLALAAAPIVAAPIVAAPIVAGGVAANASAVAGLTPRQQEVFRLMAQGLPNKSIASRLKCSDGTVKLHVSAILRALHARNRTEAVRVGNI
ncbi:MAG: hypothetical protein BWK73_05395 [Thiothrix lacustris]|uniref:DNA-binding response regulator n=1 Tax=Thiothrix lacustris TaxID=525917 RepID=A0A1Y1QX77_9GAMM|nr:MAG: hypothetical protein BWK73_05395 [Thiothrix lacustris]